MSAAEMASPARGSTRDSRIDSLRGLLLVVMAVNHIPSDLHAWTDHSLGFFSSAEGFFFLSGVLAGRVYTRRRDRVGADVARRAAWSRAAAIYGAHLAVFGVVFAWVLAFTHFAGQPPAHASMLIVERPWLALGAAILLLHQPPLFDILPVYAAFMLLLPALLALYEHGWHGRVFLASVGVWLLSFLLARPVEADAFLTHAFPWSAWQMPLVVGSVCGSLWARERTDLFAVRGPLWIGALVFCAGCFLVRHAYVPGPFPISVQESLASKNHLGPLRMLNVVAVFYLVLCVARAAPALVQWPPLAFLGRHTLPVFCAHIATAYVIYAFPGTFDGSARARWLGTGTIMAAMYVAAAAHAAWRNRTWKTGGAMNSPTPPSHPDRAV